MARSINIYGFFTILLNLTLGLPAHARMTDDTFNQLVTHIETNSDVLISITKVEAYPGETQDYLDNWASQQADRYIEAVQAEQPFEISDNPLADSALTVQQVMDAMGLTGQIPPFSNSVVTLVDNLDTLKQLQQTEAVDVRPLELYDIALDTMNRTHRAPDIWATPMGTAPNAIVGIVDTGVEKSHELLHGKVISEACFSSSHSQYIASLCPGGVPGLVAPDAGLPCADAPVCYHGTSMAGIVAASHKEGASQLFQGTAPGSRLASAQVFSTYFTERYCGKGVMRCTKSNDVDVKAALNYLYTLQALFRLIHPTLRLAAVNVSVGSDDLTQNYCLEHSTSLGIDMLERVNVPVVAAAGNESASALAVGVGCNRNAVTVGAVDARGRDILEASNRSPLIDLYAVGDRALTPTIGNTYRDGNGGTSSATAAISGAMAILKSKYPGLAVHEMVRMLKTTGTPFRYRYETFDLTGYRLSFCAGYLRFGDRYICSH
jgi:subtilisin family serine protease